MAATTASTTGNITCGGAITATGDITAFSSEVLKNDIKTIDNALDKVNQFSINIPDGIHSDTYLNNYYHFPDRIMLSITRHNNNNLQEIRLLLCHHYCNNDKFCL